MKPGEYCVIFGKTLPVKNLHTIVVKNKEGKQLVWSVSEFVYDQIMKFKASAPDPQLVISHGKELLYVDP